MPSTARWRTSNRQLSSWASSLAPSALIGSVLSWTLVPFFVFYMLVDEPRMAKGFQDGLPAPWKPYVNTSVRIFIDDFVRYFKAEAGRRHDPGHGGHDRRLHHRAHRRRAAERLRDPARRDRRRDGAAAPDRADHRAHPGAHPRPGHVTAGGRPGGRLLHGRVHHRGQRAGAQDRGRGDLVPSGRRALPGRRRASASAESSVASWPCRYRPSCATCSATCSVRRNATASTKKRNES